MKHVLIVTCAVLVFAAAAQPAASDTEQDIHKLLDAWHQAAAKADEDVFFGSMADDAIYLGTDATERWTKTELMKWSKKHFDRESAWAFDPYDRTVYVSADGVTAWFEELLKTWMGVCRGSGVLVRDAADSGWKIVHYNLAVLVPNELIEDFIAIFPDKPTKSRGSQ